MSQRVRWLLVSLPLVVLSTFAHAQTVEIFRRFDQPVRATQGTTEYVVDSMEKLTTRLSEGLPNTPAEAQRVATARLQALSAADKDALHRASTALVRAAEYNITKTPAIVFDGKAVIYGVPDVDQARTIYRGWRARGG